MRNAPHVLLLAVLILPAFLAAQAGSSASYLPDTQVAGSSLITNFPTFGSTLHFGLSDAMTNGEVTKLQAWLRGNATIYPEGLVTGFFGAATESAIKKFQCDQNIVCSGTPGSSGWGVVGPLTRSAIARMSGVQADTGSVGAILPPSAPAQSGNLQASPVPSVPNTMRFDWSGAIGDTYVINFGDSGYGAVLSGNSVDHSYTSPGNYLASLYKFTTNTSPSEVGKLLVNVPAYSGAGPDMYVQGGTGAAVGSGVSCVAWTGTKNEKSFADGSSYDGQCGCFPNDSGGWNCAEAFSCPAAWPPRCVNGTWNLGNTPVPSYLEWPPKLSI
jgi:peptidoglycan hydrolase-like protein with peptidoglycan-binding domain